MRTIIIKNGSVISSESSDIRDVVLTDGKIVAVGNIHLPNYPEAEVIDASGKLIFPGGIDPHVHLELPTPAGPSCDDFISGSRAALAGGTTCIMDFVTPRREQSLIEALYQRRAEADSSLTDYLLHMGISGWNSKSAGEIAACFEIENLRSFKAYLAYRETIGISLSQLKEMMEAVKQGNGIVMVHCEDGEMISRRQQEFIQQGKTRPTYHASSRPVEAEAWAIHEVIELSAQTGCAVYIVHVSTAAGKQAITAAKKSGIRVFAETCPQYLLLDDSVYDPTLDDRKVLPYIISPPIRSKHDQEILWEGLADGTFDTVATDHCPFNLNGQKDKGIHNFTKIPNGAGGIEHRLTLLYTYGVLSNRITLNQFVSLTSTGAAEIFGFGKRKGKIEPGYDADLVIWNPETTGVISVANHLQHCDSEIYEGFGIKGCPEMVLQAKTW